MRYLQVLLGSILNCLWKIEENLVPVRYCFPWGLLVVFILQNYSNVHSKMLYTENLWGSRDQSLHIFQANILDLRSRFERLLLSVFLESWFSLSFRGHLVHTQKSAIWVNWVQANPHLLQRFKILGCSFWTC